MIGRTDYGVYSFADVIGQSVTPCRSMHHSNRTFKTGVGAPFGDYDDYRMRLATDVTPCTRKPL